MAKPRWQWPHLAPLVCVLAGAALLLAAAPAKERKGKFTPGKDGWLTLFDGSGLAKWHKSKGADWALKDGVLCGTKGEIASYWHWADFEAVAIVRGRGALRFRVSLAPMPDQAGYYAILTDGALRRDALDGRVLQVGRDSYAEGWRELRLLVSKGKFSVYLDGHEAAVAHDNTYPAMGYLAFVPTRGPLELKRLRVRPLSREKFHNIPSPNTACYVCHANFNGEPISKTHLANEVTCATCHGPSLAHRSDEDNVTTPDVMFTRGEVDAACLRCHRRHKTEKRKKDGTGPPPANAICTDCHGKHKGVN